MNISLEQLKEGLVEPGHITEKEFKGAVKQAELEKEDVGNILIKNGIISEDNYTRVVADILGYKFVDLKGQKIDPEVFSLIPETVARAKKVVAYERTTKGISVGMLDPSDLPTIHLLEKRFGEDVNPYLVSRGAFESSVAKYASDVEGALQDLIRQFQSKTLTDQQRDSLTVEIVDEIIHFGYENKASDIHIEPYERKTLIRFRIDGVLHDIIEVDKKLEEFVLTRIKILGKMRTDEHFAAQDGKLRYNAGDDKVDIRVSVMPVTRGEKVVMRILSSKGRTYTLSDLGLLDEEYQKILDAIDHPHGMILVTGPTGSGKTTTLYAILRILNRREVNITTIEDPVEYDIEGVNQIQVNPRTDLTFAKGLRSIVRQDPDIIMVGEIRDNETAGIAVNAALTGHLVLSTLHTNDAATALPRLIDMDIEPFLVASTINVIVAQRLVRQICKSCRVSHELSAKEKKSLSKDLKPYLESRKGTNDAVLEQLTFYRGKGCPICHNTGYVGRIGIFEVLEMTEEVKALVTQRAASGVIMTKAKEQGMNTMLEDGMKKVLSGETTIEEVLRVTRE